MIDSKGNKHSEENGRFVCKEENDFKIKKKEEIAKFVEDFRKGKPTQKRIIIAGVSDKERKELERLLGDKINATTHTLHINELQHIEKRHGASGKADKSMADIEAYKHIPDVINNFDYIEANYENGKTKTTNAYIDKYGNKAQLVRYVKKENGNTSYVVEAITDTKRGDLSIITAYIQKKIER